MPLGPLAYALAFFGSLTLAWAITPLAMRLARRTGVMDSPSAIKAQDQPVPYLGGAAIVAGFVVSIVVANILIRPTGGFGEIVTILVLGLLLATVGLIDDLRGLGPFVRLLLEVLAAAVVVAVGVGVTAFDSDALNAAVTVVWVVGLVNAINLLDNMDGLSAGSAAIAAGSFLVLAAANGQFLVASLAAALAGCTLGFLRHNFHPARVYMGDAGSLFIGFILAVIGLKLRFEGPTQVTFLVPILVCGVPIFDTALVTLDRLRHRRSPLSGGRDHTSHRLVFIGLPIRWAVGVVYTSGLALGWTALVVSRIDRASAYLLVGLVMVIALVAGRMFLHVPVYGPTDGRMFSLREQNAEDALGSEWAQNHPLDV